MSKVLTGRITKSIDGDLSCTCGNETHLDGFYPSLPNGKWASVDFNEPDGDLPDGFRVTHYRCASCGAVIEYDAAP